MGVEVLPEFIRSNYEVHEWKHACAILKEDFPNEWADVVALLKQFRLKKSWITVGGGGKSSVASDIDGYLFDRGWVEKAFETKVVVDEHAMESPTHKVDCFRNRIALEIEWNNKDPFFDRDLNNFRLLFELRAISLVSCHASKVASACPPWSVARRDPQGMVHPIAKGRNTATGQGGRALRERTERATAALQPLAIRPVFPAGCALH